MWSGTASACGPTCCDEVDHRYVDHDFGAVWVGFVVAGEAAVVHEPAEGPLDDPASRNHLETLLGGVAADDFDVDAQAGAAVDGLGAVASCRPTPS